MYPRWSLAGCLAFCTIACSSGKSTTPSANLPAFKPDIGQITNRGGTLLTSAKLVTVTWTVDPNEAALEDFGDKLGASAYWKSIGGEYGVGPAVSGAANHVRVSTAPPPTAETMDMESWLVQQIMGSPGNGWPAWDVQTAYVVYVPTATKLTNGGADNCTQQGSLHTDVKAGSNDITYVLIDESCNGAQSVLAAATSAAAHEILEDVTNPYPYVGPGLLGFDTPHLAWGLIDGLKDDEIGDVCQNFADAFFMGPADLPYSLQRMWSNANAAAGHSPCVPQSTEPYFNVTPLAQETLNVLLGVAKTPKTSLGYEVPIGSTKIFSVGYYSDLPTGYWDLSAVEGNGITAPSTTHLTLSIAKGIGLNGDNADITVTVNSAADAGNAILMSVVSTAPGHTTHYVPVLIGAY